ncbi:MAG TPA: DUF2147 domain-containing protein [Sphingobium sp.]|nr:DUF2147 domain-containing protein [Sphingobium sp.]
MILLRGALALGLIMGATAVSAADTPDGIWRNPKNSVHVRVAPCRDKLCGTVVWANDKAKEDAATGMDEPLVGSMIFRDLVRHDDSWRGRIYVPNRGRTFSGAIQVIDRVTLEARGCILGGLFCKSQLWTRIGD